MILFLRFAITVKIERFLTRTKMFHLNWLYSFGLDSIFVYWSFFAPLQQEISVLEFLCSFNINFPKQRIWTALRI